VRCHERSSASPRRAVGSARSWLAVLAAAGAGGLGGPTAAGAAPVADPAVFRITPSSAPVAGVPVRVHVTGTAAGTAPADPEADSDPAVGLAILPPGVPCPGTYAEVTGAVFQDSWHWERGAPGSEPFDQAPVVWLDQPGPHNACGYFGLEGELSLIDDPEATTQVYAPTVLHVARPTITHDLALEGPLEGGQQARLLGSISSDAPVQVQIHLNRAADTCAATSTANQPRDQFQGGPEPFELYGGPRRVATAVGLPASGGAHHLCVYAFRDEQEADPDLVWSGPAVQIAPAPASPPPSATPTVSDPIDQPPVTAAPPPVVEEPEVTQPTSTPVTCSVAQIAVRRGKQLRIRCPRGRGTVGIRLRREGRYRPLRSAHLRLRGRVARWSTATLAVGRWTGRIIYQGRTAGRVRLVIRPPARAARSIR